MTAADQVPAQLDLGFYQGDDFSQSFRFYSTDDGGVTKTYLDLTGYTVTAQIRAAPRDADVLIAFTTAIASPQSGSTKGKVTISLTATQTAALSVRLAFWDLQLTIGGTTRTRIAGAVRLTPQVTR